MKDLEQQIRDLQDRVQSLQYEKQQLRERLLKSERERDRIEQCYMEALTEPEKG